MPDLAGRRRLPDKSRTHAGARGRPGDGSSRHACIAPRGNGHLHPADPAAVPAFTLKDLHSATRGG